MTTEFIVRATQTNNPLDILGIHPEMFYVTPTRGQGGITLFEAKYFFGNIIELYDKNLCTLRVEVFVPS